MEKQMDWRRMAKQRRRRRWGFQSILIRKYLHLYHRSNTITIDKGNNSTNFPLRWQLQGSFVILLTQIHSYYVKSFMLRVYFENHVKCDKKAVAAASFEGQPCKIQRLLTDNDTTSATNVTTTQCRFSSRTDYAKTTDLKH